MPSVKPGLTPQNSDSIAEKKITVRPLQVPDVPRVARIEEETYSDPWSEKMFVHHLDIPGSLNLVMELEGEIIGFACCTVIAEDLLCVENLTIELEYRQRGYGGGLLEGILTQGRKQGVATYILEVRESNQAALNLYHKFGFRVAGRRKNYYHHPVEDALIMNREEHG